MGCSGSKSGTAQEPQQNGQMNQNDKKKDEKTENWVTEEEAVSHVQSELGVSEERSKKIVALCIKNDDGKVSNDELCALWEKVKEARDRLYPKFQEYDKDKTGYVTTEEATNVLKGQMKDLSEDSIKKMVARYDDTGDGKFNFNEFVYFYGNINARKEKLEEKFKELDKDGSGDLGADVVCATLCEECILDEKMAKSLVEDFDVNKDDKFNKEEFFNIFNKLTEK